MIANKQKRRVLLSGFILLVWCAMSANAQPPSGGGAGQPSSGERRRPRTEAETPKAYDRAAVAEATNQPLNSVRVLIRYKKEYGYKDKTWTGPTSCSVFSVLARSTTAVRPERRITTITYTEMTDQYGYYVCEYLIPELPLDQEIKVTADLTERAGLTEAWQGSSQEQPPSGWQRTINEGTRTIKLTAAEPRASMAFEMVYAPMPDLMRPTSKNPLIRKP